MDSEIVIRPASIGDAEAIQSMVAALARETVGEIQQVLSVDAVHHFGFGPEKSFESLVAEQGGEIVAAVIMFDEFSTWRGQKGVYILDIYIAPPARGLGLGRRLVARVADWALLRGAQYVRLSVDEENLQAINFYEAIGFREAAHDRIFVLSGEAFDSIDRP